MLIFSHMILDSLYDDNKPLFVTAVDEQGPLAGKLFEGDKVLEMNGKELSRMDTNRRLRKNPE